MKTDLLLKDPIFQLNLLLWMAKEQQRDNYRVYPLFYTLKFKIIYIEQPFAFPEETAKLIKNSRLDISTSPEPDLILGRERDKKALYFEAKANSFGASSPSSKQARGHLLACGPVFGEVLSPLKSSLLCYLVPEDRRCLMSECLTTLTKEINDIGLKPGQFSSHGLSCKGKQIVYSWDSAFKAHTGVEEDEVLILNEVEEDTDPTPLVLVFSDQDCYDETIRNFYRQAIINQVRACLLCDLHSLDIGKKYEATPDSLLMKTTDEIFQYLGRVRQTALRRLVRENVLKKTFEYWEDKQSGVELVKDRLAITWSGIEEKDDFLNWLEDRRVCFDASKPADETPTLFDQQDDATAERAS
jgi:hypothetical protein